MSFMFWFLAINVSAINYTEAKIAGEAAVQHFFIGTYTDNGSEGIYRCGLETITGKLKGLDLVAKSENPSFLAFTKNGNYLLAVNETIDVKGNYMGYIESFLAARIVYLIQVFLESHDLGVVLGADGTLRVLQKFE